MAETVEKPEATHIPVLTTENSEESSSATSASSTEKNENNTNRVYISNVDFSTTEDDVLGFLRDYNVRSVIVPSHTLRVLKGKQQRPLGIAYAEFASHDDALRTVNELNGKELDGRQLRIKLYVPYTPKRRYSRRKQTASKTSKPADASEDAGATEDADADGSNQAEAHEAELETSDTVKQQSAHKVERKKSVSTKPEISKDTVFVGKLHPKITDTDLRAFFAEYDPSDVYIFKSKQPYRPFSFAHRHASALITLLAEDGQQNAIKDLANKRLNGRYIRLYPAYQYKIEEVKNAILSKQEELKKQALEAASDLIQEEDATTGRNEVEDDDARAEKKQENEKAERNATHEDEGNPERTGDAQEVSEDLQKQQPQEVTA